MKILKYQFLDIIDKNIYEVSLPFGSKILDTQLQRGLVTMWYTVPGDIDMNENMHVQRFGFYFTGYEHVSKNARYMNTFQFLGGELVVHMFEI